MAKLHTMCSRLPEVNEIDHKIRERKKAILGNVEGAKSKKPSVPDLQLEIGMLRAELHFYRTCFGQSLRLRQEASDICQQLLLKYYYQAILDPKTHKRAYDQVFDEIRDHMEGLRNAIEYNIMAQTAAEADLLMLLGLSQTEPTDSNLI